MYLYLLSPWRPKVGVLCLHQKREKSEVKVGRGICVVTKGKVRVLHNAINRWVDNIKVINTNTQVILISKGMKGKRDLNSPLFKYLCILSFD